MSDDYRPDPDILLAQVQRAERGRHAGRLFIFLGMCPGVGKTYAMLQMGRQRRNDGIRVLAGVVETHGRAETAALLDGLEVLPRKQIEHGGHLLDEFDLDTALARRPDLLLVDELAHTNAPGSRHQKRYQDVLELLDAGIDVCTTVNVQHIESQVDIVRQITGIAVQETVPDSILDRAHEIQLVDLGVEKLLQRLAEGKVYLGERANAAAEGFFREGNLTALREMALRFTAERVDRDLEDFRRARRDSSPWKTNARLLVGVAPTPYSESLVRWTRRAAARIGCPWIGVWVEGVRKLRPDEEEMLARGLALVRNLGGEVVHVTGDNVANALLEVARERNVSQIVVGKSDTKYPWRRSLTDRVIAGSGDIDVCVVRPFAGKRSRKSAEIPTEPGKWNDYLSALGLTALMTVVGWLAVPVSGYTVPAFIYLLAIVLASLRWQRGATLLMAAVSAVSWDYLFIPPRFTLHVDRAEDMAMLSMFFVIALAMGHLTTRLRMREKAERQRQRHTDALLRVTQQAALSPETGKGFEAALRVIESILGGKISLLVRQDDHSLGHTAHAASAFQPDDSEFAVASWAFANHQPAGRFTETLPSAQAIWFPLQTATSAMGVMGLMRESSALSFTERQAMEAFALQLALVLEKEHFIQAVQLAERLEEGEKLRRALFDSISHELKTPIAVIRAAVETKGGTPADPCIVEIDTASRRLQRIVESLLQMTRLESSVIEPKSEWCDVNDIISGSLETTRDLFKGRELKVEIPSDFPLVKTDHQLLEQCLTNLLHNAAVHTPDGTLVELAVLRRVKGIEIIVRDHGGGMAEGEEKKIFGKFYRSPGSPAGGSGLGLSIVKGFLRALGGEVIARNHPSGGAEFAVRLPVETMEASAAIPPP
ncbi:sensor histidine kinase [Luteolibacter luteus]|uniref:histidine kinase n=1 Tax=Luteolibacter luteus TaxID=2728835 RepID=A0A858RNN7_9BACT|nr:sensor histidine kinase KdpD [Luteolibacter luteus]QJE97760.1 sensor histidine kinase KdpD [Luteolibacter luteus]